MQRESTTAMRRRAVLVLLLGLLAMGDSMNDVWTQSCLEDEEVACDEASVCERGNFSRACLRSFVPWPSRYARVRCCLKCCLRHWLSALGLAENFALNANRTAVFGSRRRIDEVLMGFDTDGTMVFADYGLSLKVRKQVLETAPESFSWLDPRVRALTKKTTAARPTLVEAAFGDGCGGYAGHDFGKERRAVLDAFERDVLTHATAVFVASDDCETPTKEGERVLAHPNLVAWFATNPADWAPSSVHPTIRSPKLRAYPIGVKDRRLWVPSESGGALNGREARTDRPDLLVCCCMAHVLPPSRDPNPKKRAYRPDIARLLDNPDVLLNRSSYEALFATNVMHVSHQALVRRVRRSHVVAALDRAGFDACSLSGDAFPDYVGRMFRARFVASPHGNGRACHREFEALAAGAVPLVDYDDSPTAARLYRGLPVVRVKDWRAVTPDFLRLQFDRLQADARRRRVGLTKLFCLTGSINSHAMLA